MNRSLLTITLVFGFGGVLAAQQKTEKMPTVNFQDHVLPIFRQHCLSCHNANDAEAGLAIDSFGALMEGGGSGDVVADGDPSASRLYLVMTHDEEPTMPPDQDPIPAEQLDVIKRWIEGGLLENSGSKAKKRKGPSLAFTNSATGKPDELIMPESVWRTPVVTTQRSAAATALAASPWAPLVAVAGQRQVSLYQTETTELLGVIPYPEGIPQVLRFNRDGGYLLVAGGTHSAMGTASLYDVRSGERVLSVGDELDVVFGADINDSMTRVALGGPQKLVRIFDTSTGEAVFELKKHTDWVYTVDYSPDGVLVASGDRSGGLHVWEADTGRLYLDLVGHKDAIRSLVWRADSNVLISASEDGTVKMWEMNAGNQLKSFNAHSGGVTGVSLAQDGKIVTSGKDKTVKVWQGDGAAIATMPAFTESALEVAITHDSSKVIGGDWNGRTLMWQISDPKVSWELSANPPSLSVQENTALTRVAELGKKRDEVVTRQKAGEKIIASYVDSEKKSRDQIEIAKSELAKATNGKSAAEKRQSELQADLKKADGQLKDLESKLAAEKAKATQLNVDVKERSLALQKSTEQLKSYGEIKAALSAEITENKAQQEAMKTEVATTLSALTKREMDLLAKADLLNSQAKQAVESQAAVLAEITALDSKIMKSKETQETLTKELQSLATQIKDAEIGGSKLTAEFNIQKQLSEKLNTEISDLLTKLGSVTEETEKASIQTKIAELETAKGAAQVKLQALETEIQKTENAKKEWVVQQQNGLQKQISANAEMVKLNEGKQPLATRMSAAVQTVSAANTRKDALMKQLDALKGEMDAASKVKEGIINKISALINEEMNLAKQMGANDASMAKEMELNKLAKAELSKLQVLEETGKALVNELQGQVTTSAAFVAKIGGDLKLIPPMIAGYATQMKTQSASIPVLEKSIAEMTTKREEAQAMLVTVKGELGQAEVELGSANTLLDGIRSELVAFESRAKQLEEQAANAELLATKKMEVVKPQLEKTSVLEKAIADRQSKLAEAEATVAKIMAEMKALESQQVTDQASYTEAQKVLSESEAEAEDAEASAQEAKEKLEFFNSAYGA